jgi:hypothetical protein
MFNSPFSFFDFFLILAKVPFFGLTSTGCEDSKLPVPACSVQPMRRRRKIEAKIGSLATALAT